jgi:hypothetical protein
MIVAPQNQEYKNRINKTRSVENEVLENPLPVWRILSPYRLNVKKLPKEAYSVITEWLDKCDKLEKLNFNTNLKIKEGLKGASKGYFPISPEKLKEENKQLYDIVVDNSVGNSNFS